ncbi:MAG: hypothetical protein IKR17_05915 [Bacteroidales bacterium]|nr:hypothetical protein [Bacteroidales bacterium]
MNATINRAVTYSYAEQEQASGIRYVAMVTMPKPRMVDEPQEARSEEIKGVQVNVLNAFLDARELAEVLKCSYRTIMRYNEKGLFEKARYRVGGKYFYKTAKVLEVLDKINKA